MLREGTYTAQNCGLPFSGLPGGEKAEDAYRCKCREIKSTSAERGLESHFYILRITTHCRAVKT